MDAYKQHFVLRAGMAIEGRSITLYEEAHTIETKEKLKTQQQFLHQFKALLPPCQVVRIRLCGLQWQSYS